MGRITNYDKKVWNTYKQALTPKLSVTKGTGVASVSVSNGLKSFVNGDLITIGDTYTVTATPSSGYAHSALLINGVVKANPATVTITDNQFSVVAQASDILFDLTVVGNHMTLAVIDGDIEYSAGANVLPLGAEVVITATNDVGYEVTGITVNGVAFTNGDTLVVSTNTEVEVFVAELSHDLAITKDANCTVTVMYGEDELVAGEDAIPNSAELVITATADSGYSIASLTVNGTAFTSGESIVATTDIAVVVTVANILFDLSTTLTGCVLSISDGVDTYEAGSNVIPKNAELTITAFPSEGYTIEGMTLTVDGVAFTSGNTTDPIIANVSIVATAIKVWELDIEATGCTLVVSDGTNTYGDSDMIVDGTVITIIPTASEGYTLDGMTFTINATPYTSGANYTVEASVGVVATAIALDLPLVGEIDFNINSTWNSGNEFYVVDTVPELDFSSVADGDVNLKITVTLDGNPMTIKGTRFSSEDFIVIGDLFDAEGLISVASGVKIGVMEGIGANVDSIFLVAPENYLSTHTVVLNSIEIDENIEEILSGDISYVYDSVDTFDGTITMQTLDVSGLTHEQDNIYTYWDIDGTRYLVPATAIINGTTTSLQESALLDSIAITLNVGAKIIDTDGTLTTEITGSALTGTEAITLLAVFVETSPT